MQDVIEQISREIGQISRETEQVPSCIGQKPPYSRPISSCPLADNALLDAFLAKLVQFLEVLVQYLEESVQFHFVFSLFQVLLDKKLVLTLH